MPSSIQYQIKECSTSFRSANTNLGNLQICRHQCVGMVRNCPRNQLWLVARKFGSEYLLLNLFRKAGEGIDTPDTTTTR